MVATVNNAAVILYWYRHPVDGDGLKTDDADLTMQFRQGDAKSGPGVRLAYDESPGRGQRGKFSVEGRGFSTRRAEWSSTGSIVSLLDLPGSQVFIKIYDDGWDYAVPPAKRDFREMVLNIGDAAPMWFYKERCVRHVGRYDVRYEFRFPPEYAELAKAVRWEQARH
jgi:hypothetical protein